MTQIETSVNLINHYSQMNGSQPNVLLADDDRDDCFFFREVLEELGVASILRTVSNGEELMQLLLDRPDQLPDILFLDLNMPLKTGMECLSEIKTDNRLKQLPVIIFSTSFKTEVVDMLYDMGAFHYIRKPSEFTNLRKVIKEALCIPAQAWAIQPAKGQFVLQPNKD